MSSIRRISKRIFKRAARILGLQNMLALKFGDRPIQLKGRTARSSVVLYIGNGAESNWYEDHFRENRIRGRSYSGLGGFFDQCAFMILKDQNYSPVLCFSHSEPDVVFAGFTIRTKVAGSWLWYTEEGWKKTRDLETPPKRFFEGEKIPVLPNSGKYVYVLTANWQDESGRTMNCGYPMFRNNLMAHALGTKDGHHYLNTMGAMQHSIEMGIRYFEADFSLTDDKRLVVMHGWTATDMKLFGLGEEDLSIPMTYDRVRSFRIYGDPVMDAHEFYLYLKNIGRDYMLEVDFHRESKEKTKIMIREFLKDFEYDEEVLKRILIQVYNRNMFYAIRDEYPFKNYQFNIHDRTADTDKMIDFCLEQGITACAIRAVEAKPEHFRMLKNAGLYVLCYTVSKDYALARTILDWGADTICSNFMRPDKLENQEQTLGHYPYSIRMESSLKIPRDLLEGMTMVLDKMDTITMTDGFRNDGNDTFPNCPFTDEKKIFRGWVMRMGIDNAAFYYCEDTILRKFTKIKKGTPKVPRVFSPGEKIPAMYVLPKSTIVLNAVWEEV